MVATHALAPSFILTALAALGRGQERFPEINATRAARPQNEPSIAVDPENPLNLVIGAHDYRAVFKRAGVFASFDGGLTWSSALLHELDPELAHYQAQGDSAIAAYRHGVFYYSYIDHNGNDDKNRIVVARSDDGGLTWPSHGVPVDHPSANSAFFEDKPYLAVDTTKGPFDGRVYVSWVHISTRGNLWPQILFSSSSDGAMTFSAPAALGPRTPGVTGPQPVVGPEGQVYVVWRSLNTIRLDVSLDGGVTFGLDRLVAHSMPLPSPLPGALFRVAPFPSLAVDHTETRTRGRLYVVWADANGVGQGPDVLLASSLDQGDTWSQPVRVSDDTNGSFQFFPWVVVGPDGTVSVVFHDQRDTPGSPRYHTSVAHSFDGGLSFQPNVRISAEASDATLGEFGGTFIGDYIGICASPRALHPVWTDIRPSVGNAELFVRALRVRRP